VRRRIDQYEHLALFVLDALALTGDSGAGDQATTFSGLAARNYI
jgi:hypothetical protein